MGERRRLSTAGLWLLGVVVCLAIPPRVSAATSFCDGLANNQLLNCGFELGGGGAPVDWTTDAGWALHAGTFNMTESEFVNSGTLGLQLGNFENETPAGISQTFATVAGQSYTVSFFLFYQPTADTTSFINAVLDGSTQFTRSGSAGALTSFTEFTFGFTGTGSDTLAFIANTQQSEWFLDDVSVVGPTPVAGVPEPAPVGMVVSGLAAVAFRLRRRRV